ncbi:hypothetical protein CRUP_031437 [Coryphaenoides rupestris]|nr:hypothetical protein CRUP_031437 [Coryphaenoides rupestris]
MVNLSIDGGLPTTMDSFRAARPLNGEAPLYVGGMPVDVHSAAFRPGRIQNGSSFHGCIQNLYINNELQDFTNTQMKPGVVPGCEPCRKIYCLHGICQPDAAQGPSYRCECAEGYRGTLCNQQGELFNPCHRLACKHGRCQISDTGTPTGHCGERLHRGALRCRCSAATPSARRRALVSWVECSGACEAGACCASQPDEARKYTSSAATAPPQRGGGEEHQVWLRRLHVGRRNRAQHTRPPHSPHSHLPSPISPTRCPIPASVTTTTTTT